ncbi:MAG: hypothetical protein ACRDJ2_00530 [Actinomycetota bacterium]
MSLGAPIGICPIGICPIGGGSIWGGSIGVGSIGVGLLRPALEFYRALFLTFCLFGVTPGGEICFTRALRCALGAFPMLGRLHTLLLEPLATGRPHDQRNDHERDDDYEHDYDCGIH